MTLTPISFTVLALAVWRLSLMLSWEEGPWGLFERLRAWTGVRYDGDGAPYGTNWLARGLLCSWCNSIWMATALGLVYWLWPPLAWALAVVPALSAAAILVDAAVGRMSGKW